MNFGESPYHNYANKTHDPIKYKKFNSENNLWVDLTYCKARLIHFGLV